MEYPNEQQDILETALQTCREAALKVPLISTYKDKELTKDQLAYLEFEKTFRETLLEQNPITDNEILKYFYLRRGAL